MFNLKRPTFERLIRRFIKLLITYLFESFVPGVKDECNMSYMLENGKTFKSFPFARHKTDVTSQQSNPSSENMQ